MARTGNKGFTLIELLVVMSIISLLASVVLVSLTSARTKAKTGATIEFASTLERSAVPIGKWDFDACSGATAIDSSNNNYTLTSSAGAGTPVWSTEQVYGSGCSLSFDGATYIVSHPSFPNFSQSNFTISLWFKQSNTGAVFADGSSGVRIFGDGQIVLIDQSTNTYNYTNPPTTCAAGVWCHVAVTYKITAGVGTATEYINGKKISTATGILPLRVSSGIQIGGSSSTYQVFSGLIDNVRIFDTALLSQDIGKMYAEEAPRHTMASRE